MNKRYPKRPKQHSYNLTTPTAPTQPSLTACMGENARRSVVNWEALVPLEDWNEYLPILQAAKKRKIPLAITGGLAYSEYACQMRNTKDIDLLVSPEQKDEIVSILVENGWADYEK